MLVTGTRPLRIFDGEVIHPILNRMACFMGRHSQRRHRRGIVHTLGQPDHIGPGIIVIGKLSSVISIRTPYSPF